MFISPRIASMWCTLESLHSNFIMSCCFSKKLSTSIISFSSVFFIIFIYFPLDALSSFQQVFPFVIVVISFFSFKIPIVVWFLIAFLAKKQNMSVIGGGQKILDWEGRKLRPCNIWKLNVWLLLRLELLFIASIVNLMMTLLATLSMTPHQQYIPSCFEKNWHNTTQITPNKDAREIKECCKISKIVLNYNGQVSSIVRLGSKCMLSRLFVRTNVVVLSVLVCFSTRSSMYIEAYTILGQPRSLTPI